MGAFGAREIALQTQSLALTITVTMEMAVASYLAALRRARDPVRRGCCLNTTPPTITNTIQHDSAGLSYDYAMLVRLQKQTSVWRPQAHVTASFIQRREGKKIKTSHHKTPSATTPVTISTFQMHHLNLNVKCYGSGNPTKHWTEGLCSIILSRHWLGLLIVFGPLGINDGLHSLCWGFQRNKVITASCSSWYCKCRAY